MKPTKTNNRKRLETTLRGEFNRTLYCFGYKPETALILANCAVEAVLNKLCELNDEAARGEVKK